MNLTRRERDVLLLIADGKSNKMIARELGLSVNTVKRHAVRLYNRIACWIAHRSCDLVRKGVAHDFR